MSVSAVKPRHMSVTNLRRFNDGIEPLFVRIILTWLTYDLSEHWIIVKMFLPKALLLKYGLGVESNTTSWYITFILFYKM